MITDAIHRWAAATPRKTAVEFDGQPLAYADFARAIDAAQGWFAAQGLGGDGVVILALKNMMDFWGFSLALRRLGLHAAAARSAEDVAALAMPGVRAVVRAPNDDWAELDAACAAHGWPVLRVPTRLVGEAPAPSPRPGGQILQTSGTTGVYKKVLMDPAWEEGFIRRRGEVFGIEPSSVHCLFDFGGWTGAGYKSAAAAWLAGATVILRQSGPLHLALGRPGITHATLIPQKLAAVLSAPAGVITPNPGMRLFITGGSLSQTVLDETRARITPHVVSSLGATECLTFAHTLLREPQDRRWHRVLPDAGVEIVDDADRPVAMGVVGRLRVTAAGGPQGYMLDPAGTAAFFKDGRFYPGDLGVLREDGRLALQGRVTEVINVEGNKIAPAPIEEAIRDALGVGGVCILTLQDAAGEEQAHVVIETGAPIGEDALATVLSAQLTGFPRAHVHYVSALPRNDMGKVLRRAVQASLGAPA